MNYPTNDSWKLSNNSYLPLNLSTRKRGPYMDVILPGRERESSMWLSSSNPVYQPHHFENFSHYQISQLTTSHFSQQHFNHSTLFPNLQDTNFGKFPANSHGSIRSDSNPYGGYVRNHQYLSSSQRSSTQHCQSAAQHCHLTESQQHHKTATQYKHQTSTQQYSTVQQHYQTVQQHNQTVPQHNQTVPQHYQTVQQHNETVQQHNETVQQHYQTVQQHYQTVQQHNQTVQQHYQTVQQHNETVPQHNETVPQHNETVPQHNHQNATQLFLHQHQNETPRHQPSTEPHHLQSSIQHRMVTPPRHDPEIQQHYIEKPLTKEILHPFTIDKSQTKTSSVVSGIGEWDDYVSNPLLCSKPEKSDVKTISLAVEKTKPLGVSARDIFMDNAALIKNSFLQVKKQPEAELNSKNKNCHLPVKNVFHKNTDMMTQDGEECFSSSSSPPPVTDALSTDKSSGSSGRTGLQELLLLPSSYTELSVFQKKYFPTNNYSENSYLNTVINIQTNSKPIKCKSELKNQEEVERKETERVSALCRSSNSVYMKNDSLCEVCSGKAAGFYCGAFVCEACKKFFMRAVKLKSVHFTCLRDKKCIITKENRIRCQYCRYMKCLELKMFCPGSNPEVEDEAKISQLPCQVCGALSSGFHFGALTCEGCKGFFRRMTKERDPGGYQCLKDKNCPVTMTTRNICKACRYKKCTDCGMSVSSSRIGRKPNVIKHALALARKNSSLQNNTHREPDVDAFTTSSSSSTCSSSSMPSSSTQSTSNATAVKSSEDKKKVKDLRTILESDCYDVIERIKKAATELEGIFDQSYREKDDEADEYVDHKAVFNKLMKRFEIHMKCVIRFSKKVPGFSLLDIETQVLMIQLSVYTIILLKMSEKYQPEDPIVFDFSVSEWIQVQKFFPFIELMEQHLKHIGTMRRSLSLDKTEMCIMAVLLLLDEESVSDEEKDKVSDIQEKVMECLKVYEEDNYNSGSVRYGVILVRLGEFSLASLQYGQALAGVTVMYPDLDMPQLLTDMMLK